MTELKAIQELPFALMAAGLLGIFVIFFLRELRNWRADKTASAAPPSAPAQPNFELATEMHLRLSDQMHKLELSITQLSAITQENAKWLEDIHEDLKTVSGKAEDIKQRLNECPKRLPIQ